MSVTVKHLNADSTFLLTFISAQRIVDYTILIDPWLAGASSVWNERFQISHHTSRPHVESLADLDLPDLILISQDKPDHCHEETLRTLPADAPVNILAVPPAVKKIKSWRHFTNATITPIAPYNSKNSDTVHYILLNPEDRLSGALGDITIAYMPQRHDMTGLHNAFGITYNPSRSNALPNCHGHKTQSLLSPPITPELTPTSSKSSSADFLDSDLSFDSPLSAHFPLRYTDLPIRTRPLSILYSPHGINMPYLNPYLDNYLAPLGALPLTVLMHAINVERNPWFLGGLVASGLPGGTDLIKRLGARYWLSAHDEAKDNRGWSTTWIKSRHYTIEEAQVLLDDELERAEDRLRGDNHTDELWQRRTDIVGLDVGEELYAEI